MFNVEFYETIEGKCPVVDFLDSLDPKMRAKMVSMMEILGEKGTELRKPYTEPLGDGLFELRAKQGLNISRALFFFYIGKRIIITNGFIKKQQKTPKNQINIAKTYKDDFYKREGGKNDKIK